jgi:hypothetical protein
LPPLGVFHGLFLSAFVSRLSPDRSVSQYSDLSLLQGEQLGASSTETDRSVRTNAGGAKRTVEIKERPSEEQIMSGDIVTLEVSDHIALVTLNRPPVNALNRAMRERIVSIFDEISERRDVRVAILTGAGKVFCSGADLKDRPDATQIGAFHSHNRITRETCVYRKLKLGRSGDEGRPGWRLT